MGNRAYRPAPRLRPTESTKSFLIVVNSTQSVELSESFPNSFGSVVTTAVYSQDRIE